MRSTSRSSSGPEPFFLILRHRGRPPRVHRGAPRKPSRPAGPRFRRDPTRDETPSSAMSTGRSSRDLHRRLNLSWDDGARLPACRRSPTPPSGCSDRSRSPVGCRPRSSLRIGADPRQGAASPTSRSPAAAASTARCGAGGEPMGAHPLPEGEREHSTRPGPARTFPRRVASCRQRLHPPVHRLRRREWHRRLPAARSAERRVEPARGSGCSREGQAASSRQASSTARAAPAKPTP